MKYRAEIEGLRALAVIPVILLHAGFEVFSGGFVGVDVFFVISGYLITTTLIDDIENNRFKITDFYERRARRILPALFFVVISCVPFAWIWMSPNQMDSFSQSVAAIGLFVSNILFWTESNYFASASLEKPLLHTWSLSVEEQYYLLFPVFLIMAWRFGKNRVFWMIVVLSIASLIQSERSWVNDPSGNFYLAPTRAWEIFAGSITAFVAKSRGVVASNALALLGLLAVFTSIFYYDSSTPFPSVYALLPVSGVVLIILFAEKNTFVCKLLTTRILVGTGLISYSAYLWHQPLFAFARIRSVDEPSNYLMAALSLLSIGLAVLSWKYIEQPFRRKTFLEKYQVFLYGTLGILIFVSLGMTGHFMKGVESRMKRQLQGDIGHRAFHEYINNIYFDCTPTDIADTALKWEGFLRCKQSKKGLPNLILLGDSHAEHLFLGVAEALPNINVAFYILNGKPFLSDIHFNKVFNELLTNKREQHVLLTMYYFNRMSSSGDDLYREFKKTIIELQNAGKHVVLVGDIPGYSVNPDACVYSITNKSDERCSMTLDQANSQKEFYRSTLEALSTELGVQYIDIYEPLCSSTTCSMVKGDFVLYRDTNHLNIIGSMLVGGYLVKKYLDSANVRDN